MNALSLYVTTCRMVFQADINDNGAWNDINRLIMYLRQSLSCCVCGQLLTIPMTSAVASCQHHVCKGCIGGKMRLKPSCSWCKDYSKFIENIQLRIILQCYKRLSNYIKKSEISKKWASLQTGNTPGVLIGSSANSINSQNSCPLNFKDLVDEGSKLQDKFTFFEPPTLRNLNKSNTTNSSNSSINQNLNSSLNFSNNGSESFDLSNQKKNSSKNCINNNDDLTKNSSQATIISFNNQNNDSSLSIFSSQLVNNLNSSLNTSQTNLAECNINSSTNNSTNTNTPAKNKNKVRKGCRCGMATSNPGKLTCCGQRCPCYVEGKACFECKCRGCRNPNKNNSSNNNESVNQSTNKQNNINMITAKTSPNFVPSSLNIQTNNPLNESPSVSFNNNSNTSCTNLNLTSNSSLISSPNFFTSSSIQLNNSNQTNLFSSSNNRNLLSPSFLLSSSPNSSPSTNLINNSNNHLLRNNMFTTGAKINIISSTSSSPSAAFIGVLGNNNVGNVPGVSVDSLTLPFPKLEEIDDDHVISSENVACIGEDATSLHQSILPTIDLQIEPEIITVVTELTENDQIKIEGYDQRQLL